MALDRRDSEPRDRRAHPRGGRRATDARKPWYIRRRMWLAAASFVFLGWQRVRKRYAGRHELAD